MSVLKDRVGREPNDRSDTILMQGWEGTWRGFARTVAGGGGRGKWPEMEGAWQWMEEDGGGDAGNLPEAYRKWRGWRCGGPEAAAAA